MVRINLKGIAKVTVKGHTYYYAWRGGPRLQHRAKLFVVTSGAAQIMKCRSRSSIHA
jgi:uncharacterized ParB-like nuclease family protein